MKKILNGLVPQGTTKRRSILKAGLGVMAASFVGAQAFAQSAWPNKSIRVIVPFSAGGAADTSARAICAALGETIGQSVIVENRTGGNAMIAAQAVLQAPADGYTFLWDAANQLTNPILLKNIAFDYKSSFVPVSLAVRVPQVLAVRENFPAKNLKEFVAYAKANPKKVTCGTPPSGGMGHLAIAMFQQVAGIELIHTPYRGGADAVRDLMGGQIDSTLLTLSTAIGAVQAGKARILGLTSLERTKSYPDVPTIAEQGYPGFDMDDWFGFFAAKGTPKQAIDGLQAATTKAAKSPAVIKTIDSRGMVLVVNTPAQFASWLEAQRAALEKLIRTANISIG
ncbi:Bug family tripartite tricarboxylate transporter substrate binding protein [Zwartia sp.]|uniref:Bug family tripartite tricarboxylate transporter substrate binding protein n=1 Tax=Zwartia sp. TaxID=2978004 RepID=UPI003BAECC11